MLSEEIKKRFEERIIKWITIESEVMNEVNAMFLKGEITQNDWNDYFIGIVKKHGNELLTSQVEVFREIQDKMIELMTLNTTKKISPIISEKELMGLTEDWTNTEGLLEDLNGKLYEPLIINGVYICPICKGDDGRMTPMIALNTIEDDPDYLYYRCPKCKIDFKIINKADKDFKLRINAD